jgi:hypothetical protein
MSFREMCSKARDTQTEILEYQNSRIQWLFDTVKVAEEVGLTVQQNYPNIGVYCYGQRCWEFKIETGSLLSAATVYRWRPHKQGKHHRIIMTSCWKADGEVVIDQIEEGEEGLAELRTAVQTWLANQVAKRGADRLVKQYQDLGYMPR